MANSVVTESLQDFSRQPSTEIIQESEARMSQCFIKEEKPEKSLCARKDWQQQTCGKFENKEGSPLRSLSPEFLLKLSGDSAEYSNEMREEEIYRKGSYFQKVCVYFQKV